jgi:DMSO/TMAO reductase YedYZ heme-binding membrane subunit
VKKADIIISLLLIALGCGAFYVASTEYSDGTQYTPMIYSAGLAALSLVLLLTALFRKERQSDQPKPQSVSRLLSVLGFIAAYIALIYYLGFYAATEIFLVSFMIAMKATTPLKAVIISSVVTGLLYLFFSVVLLVPTPRGLLI